MSDIGNKDIMAENLKYYIERSGKDRRELAETWGFPYSTVSDWINGKKYPRIDRIEIMADYFGIMKSDLIERKKEKAKITLNDEGEQKLVALFREVPEADRYMVIQMVEAALAAKKRDRYMEEELGIGYVSKENKPIEGQTIMVIRNSDSKHVVRTGIGKKLADLEKVGKK